MCRKRWPATWISWMAATARSSASLKRYHLSVISYQLFRKGLFLFSFPRGPFRSPMKTLLAFLMIFAATVIQAQTDKFAPFRDTYLREVKAAGIVGSSFVFLKDGKIAFEHHYGSANLEKKQAVD